MSRAGRRVGSVLVMAGAATSLVASELSIPHSFTSGTPAVAAQVNANFEAARVAVNDNNTRINQLLTQVQALQQRVTDLEGAAAGSNIAMGIFNAGNLTVQQLRVRSGVAVTATNPQVGRVELQVTGADTAQPPIVMVTPHAPGTEAPTCNTRLLSVTGPTDYLVRIDCFNAAGAATTTSFQFLVTD